MNEKKTKRKKKYYMVTRYLQNINEVHELQADHDCMLQTKK